MKRIAVFIQTLSMANARPPDAFNYVMPQPNRGRRGCSDPNHILISSDGLFAGCRRVKAAVSIAVAMIDLLHSGFVQYWAGRDRAEEAGYSGATTLNILCLSRRFSMTWQRTHRQRSHQPRVHFRPAAPSRMPYLPHGSVNPHLRHRITQPGARRSNAPLSCSSLGSDMMGLSADISQMSPIT